MARKESPNKKDLPKEEFEAGPQKKAASRKFSWFGSKLFDIIKFLLGVSLLPFVYSSTASFLNEFGVVPKGLQTYFCAGAITFIAVYLFVLEPSMVYNAGHKILEVLFQFFTPLVKVAPFLLPIYTIVIFVLYKFAALFIRSDWLLQYAMFLFGFTLALHLVFSSKSMRSRKGDLLKGNYIFGFSFIYIVNLGIMAFCLNLIFKDFSFVDFCNSSYATARDLYHSVFSQLFLK